MTAEELCGRIWKRLIAEGSGGGYAVTLKYTELLGVIRETMEACAQAAEEVGRDSAGHEAEAIAAAIRTRGSA